MAHDVMPFVRPAPGALVASPWELDDAEGTRELPELLPDWDPQADLALHRRVAVEYHEVLAACRLPVSTPLLVVVDWHSSAAHLAGSAFRHAVVEPTELTVKANLASANLGGTLVLKTRLVLADDVPDSDWTRPFSPRHAGDILWEETVEVHLEGVASRFPTSVIDFKLRGFDEDARWAIDIPDDPTVPAAGGVRLYLNQSDAELVTAATRAATPTPLQRRLIEAMYDDVARQLVEACLRPAWRDVLIDAAEEPGSLAESLIILLSNLFEGEPLDAVVARRDADPSVFATTLQGSLRRTRREEP
ncbi:hypothetical protein ABZT27_24525 [Streptomyces sp. NPDC005389]|uniref:hypothetical protein n=1 Tax=Streptomyces sp. NPDC005389 TaxID=3157040 RepID=UPI0033B5B9B9